MFSSVKLSPTHCETIVCTPCSAEAEVIRLCKYTPPPNLLLSADEHWTVSRRPPKQRSTNGGLDCLSSMFWATLKETVVQVFCFFTHCAVLFGSGLQQAHLTSGLVVCLKKCCTSFLHLIKMVTSASGKKKGWDWTEGIYFWITHVGKEASKFELRCRDTWAFCTGLRAWIWWF